MINKKGVSLAELLAVVVIMGIIAAIAVPLVGQLIEDTRKDAVLGDARTVASSAQTYCLVNPDEILCNSSTTTILKKDLKPADENVETNAPGFLEYISTDFDNSSYTDIRIVFDTTTNRFKVLMENADYKFADSQWGTAGPADPLADGATVYVK